MLKRDKLREISRYVDYNVFVFIIEVSSMSDQSN